MRTQGSQFAAADALVPAMSLSDDSGQSLPSEDGSADGEDVRFAALEDEGAAGSKSDSASGAGRRETTAAFGDFAPLGTFDAGGAALAGAGTGAAVDAAAWPWHTSSARATQLPPTCGLLRLHEARVYARAACTLAECARRRLLNSRGS